jgi:cytochrome b subunit of formate dehydrogenase
MSPRKTFNHYLMKLNRVIVWILLLFILMLIISGYGLTKPSLIRSLTGGWIDYHTALLIHTSLDTPLLVLLLTHVLIEMKFTLMRWGVKNQKLLNLLMLILMLICLILIIYVKFAETEWWYLG